MAGSFAQLMYSALNTSSFSKTKELAQYFQNEIYRKVWLGGAMVARLTPDQKVVCSNHVRVKDFYKYQNLRKLGCREKRTSLETPQALKSVSCCTESKIFLALCTYHSYCTLEEQFMSSKYISVQFHRFIRKR